MTDRELTTTEAANELGYHREHIYRLLREGTLRGRRLIGTIWVIPQSEIDRIKALQDEHGRLPRSDQA